ncbi:MAG: 2-keto-4-pentenoate hydratase [Isosphaeraceae bacterium]
MLRDLDARPPWHSFVPPNNMTPEQAYALQGEVARLREARGERVVGYKLGCTSQVIQEQLGTREPIFGRIFNTGCFPDGNTLDHTRFAGLAIEGELAIRLGRDLACGDMSDEEVAQALESVFPVIELHHYVLPETGCSLTALIASGGMHAGLVFPRRETVCEGRIPEVGSVEVIINDRIVGATGEPWTMGSPAASLRWLTSRLARLGLHLHLGQIILTGSPLPLFPVAAGDRVNVEARALGTSTVSIA